MSGAEESFSSAELSPARARALLVKDTLGRISAQSGMTLLVDGLEGSGKTYLLSALSAATTAEDRLTVSFVRADEIESGEPYSFIERFVATSAIPDWYFIPDEDTTPVALARECVQRLTPNVEAPARLMVIDDAQWIDEESQRVLRYLIPRVTRRGITLAFGVRTPGSEHSFGEFLARLVAENPLDMHYELAPFTLQEIAAYTLERLGVGISVHTAQRFLEETGGTFLGLESLLSTLTQSEISQLHFAWDRPARTTSLRNDPLLYEFTKLSPAGQRNVEIVCLAGHEIGSDDLQAACLILKEPLALDEALGAGVLTRSGFGSAIMPQHALFARAVRGTVDEERTRAVHRALASVTPGYRSLRHTLLGEETWSEELRRQVFEFVSDSARGGAPTLASDVLRTALELAEEPDARAELLESLALVHIQAKNGYLMLDLLTEIEALPYSVLHEFIAIVIAAHKVGGTLPLERVQRLLMTPPSDADEQAALGFFAFMIVILTMRSVNIEAVPTLIAHAKQLIESGPQSESDLSDTRLAWMIDRDGYLLVLDAYLMVQDQIFARMDLVQAALPELTDRVITLPDSPLKVDAAVAIAGAKLAIGDVSGGRQLVQHGVDLIERVSEPWAASTARLMLADIMVMQGAYGDAADLMALTEELSYTSLDVETRSVWAALRVFIAAVTGGEHPEAHVAQARRQKEVPWEGYSPDLLLIAECELGRVQGDHAAVLEASTGGWADQLANTRHGFLTYRAHALISLGQYDEAVALIDQLAGWRGVRWHEYWGTLDWLRARLAQGLGDLETARWHYEAAIMQRDFPLPLSLTLADYGEFLMQQNEPESAVTTLALSVEMLASLGAEGYLPRVAGLLQSLEQEQFPEQNREGLLELLTAREQQIVDHLIKGRSNSQIAEGLVVSVTTVRSHVSNILRKLRLSSRGEVARLFRKGEPAQ